MQTHTYILPHLLYIYNKYTTHDTHSIIYNHHFYNNLSNKDNKHTQRHGLKLYLLNFLALKLIS